MDCSYIWRYSYIKSGRFWYYQPFSSMGSVWCRCKLLVYVLDRAMYAQPGEETVRRYKYCMKNVCRDVNMCVKQHDDDKIDAFFGKICLWILCSNVKWDFVSNVSYANTFKCLWRWSVTDKCKWKASFENSELNEIC